MNTNPLRNVRCGSLAVTLLMAGFTLTAVASDDDYRKETGMAPSASPAYVESCGGCHVPYAPGFLLPQSWERIMSGLADHFGENAELPPDDAKKVLNFLLDNAAGRMPSRLSTRLQNDFKNGEPPMRITETGYFRAKHHELNRKMVQDNPKVRSFSHCDACHPRAVKGAFSEHEVRIPGYGHWED